MIPTDVKSENIPLWLALVPLAFLMCLLAGAVAIFGDGASSGPNQIGLMLAAGMACLIGVLRGQSWKELESSIIEGIMLAMHACLILLMIGSLIGAWMLSGTAPAIIHLGLGVLDPAWFYPASMIVCALVAVSIGSSWTTAATVGLALIGIAHILGLSIEITAGAVISGAYFGDKMSPLSDSTNLAPAMVGVDLFIHIRHMFWTTTPAFVIALCLFVWLGWTNTAVSTDGDAIETARLLLEQNYALGIPAFLPLVLLLGLSIRKVPALPTITIGAIAGGLVAAFYQTDATIKFGNMGENISDGLAIIKGLWIAVSTGYEASTGDAVLDQLLSRGGMSSMLNTVWLIISAMCFGGAMEHTGLLGRIVLTALKGVRGTGSLVATTVLTSIGMNIIAADQYIAIVLPGRMYQMEFKRRGLAPQNLSRTLEDAGTMTSALVPWNTCGAFMATTLGVPTFDYLPYAFLNLITPVVAITYGLMNIRITALEIDLPQEDVLEVVPERIDV
ncbi:Na+/H+ antiporter NhaC [Emcibacter sp.]|uniref:Na+/H+ antiporter NhaC n=1 Tax=Emcibacter sp. TaxID=1979954 RepID=UPI002AA842FA|nr:Na+/H+ antiporter NhaC [Emcibacter sp.]